MKQIGVLLSGSGVFDGSEIHESVLSLLALDQLGARALCMAPDIPQHHVVNHITGDDMPETRNVLIEAARIARGQIRPLGDITAADIDGLVMPGGFGAAKNLSSWAFDGPDGKVEQETQRLLRELVEARKPIAALCVSPVVLAKALQDSGITPTLTLGTTTSPSPYDIAAFNAGVGQTGATTVPCELGDIIVDTENRIVTSPCYMMEAGVAAIYDGVHKACAKLLELTA